MSHKILAVAVGLLLTIGLSQAAFATYAVPDDNIGTGVIQAVNVNAHSVTVAGHEYLLAPKAVYIGNGGVQVRDLQPGMHVRFIADGPVKNPASRIVNVVVLPPSSP